MDLVEYKGALELLGDAVNHLGEKPDDAESLRRSLDKAWIVRAGEQRYEVSLAWFDAELAAFVTEPKLRAQRKEEMLGRIATLRGEAEALEKTAAKEDVAAARAALEKIMQRSEFKASVVEPSWWDRAKAWFGDWVDRILDKIFGHRIRRGRDILIWVVIAVAFGLLAWMGARFLLRAARTEAMRIESPRPAGKTWSEWAQEALRAAAKGDYRQAVHAAYWAGVFRLADLGTWEIDRSRTPREYLHLLEARKSSLETDSAERAARAAALASLTRRLEFTWYGFEAATEADFREAITHLEALGCRFPSNLATAKS